MIELDLRNANPEDITEYTEINKEIHDPCRAFQMIVV